MKVYVDSGPRSRCRPMLCRPMLRRADVARLVGIGEFAEEFGMAPWVVEPSLLCESEIPPSPSPETLRWCAI